MGVHNNVLVLCSSKWVSTTTTFWCYVVVNGGCPQQYCFVIFSSKWVPTTTIWCYVVVNGCPQQHLGVVLLTGGCPGQHFGFSTSKWVFMATFLCYVVVKGCWQESFYVM